MYTDLPVRCSEFLLHDELMEVRRFTGWRRRLGNRVHVVVVVVRA